MPSRQLGSLSENTKPSATRDQTPQIVMLARQTLSPTEMSFVLPSPRQAPHLCRAATPICPVSMELDSNSRFTTMWMNTQVAHNIQVKKEIKNCHCSNYSKCSCTLLLIATINMVHNGQFKRVLCVHQANEIRDCFNVKQHLDTQSTRFFPAHIL